MARELIEGMLAKAKELRRLADGMEENARRLQSMEGTAQVLRKPDAWRVADAIERIMEYGEKSMSRAELIQTLLDQKAVGGKDEDQMRQYAAAAIKRGDLHGYLKEDQDGTLRWVPGIRKSRVSKKL